MNFEIGTKVTIDKCDACPTVVGKTATVMGVISSDESGEQVTLNFGRGRPQAGRPESISVEDVSLFVEKQEEVNA